MDEERENKGDGEVVCRDEEAGERGRERERGADMMMVGKVYRHGAHLAAHTQVAGQVSTRILEEGGGGGSRGG